MRRKLHRPVKTSRSLPASNLPPAKIPPPFSRHIVIGKADFLAIATNGCFYETNGIFCHLNGCFYLFNCMKKEKIKVFIFVFRTLKTRKIRRFKKIY
jgi:hypothetical protein